MGPFHLGCETQTPKVVEISLDCIQKLVADGFFVGTGYVRSRNNQVKQAVDALVGIVADCSNSQVDTILLQVKNQFP